MVAGRSIRVIASELGRAPSTISREIKRNGGRATYRGSKADQAAWDRARRPKQCKLALHPASARIVTAKLQLQWAPEQIAGRAVPGHSEGDLFFGSRGSQVATLMERQTRYVTLVQGEKQRQTVVDISRHSQSQLNSVARTLNERPRKTLNFRTPAGMFSQIVASTSCIHSQKRASRRLTDDSRLLPGGRFRRSDDRLIHPAS